MDIVSNKIIKENVINIYNIDEIPSKDNMSVASYNPSSRYASNNKRDRDDSSQRRNDYGNYRDI